MNILGSKSDFYRGCYAAFPLVLSYLPFALLLGAQAIQHEMKVAEISTMVALNFAGGSEFVAVKLWTSPPHILLIAFMTFLVNSRHILMGAALTPYLYHLPTRKVLLSLFLMTDESWAVGYADAKNNGYKQLNFPFYFGVSIALYIAWFTFTTTGAVIGPLFGDLNRYGFDMAFVAVFLVLIKGFWSSVYDAIPWLVSLVAAVIAYNYIAGAWYVLIGAGAGLLVAVLRHD